jgi:diguanylate cyclase (GGDEF)-like protein
MVTRGRPFGLALLDLDDFKRVNDRLGHQEGDDVLREFARVAQRSLRVNEELYRVGGDEFLAVCEDMPSVVEGLAIAERIRAALATSFQAAGKGFELSASVGIVFATRRHETPADLVRDADRAMYVAKEQGGDRVVLAGD